MVLLEEHEKQKVNDQDTLQEWITSGLERQLNEPKSGEVTYLKRQEKAGCKCPRSSIAEVFVVTIRQQWHDRLNFFPHIKVKRITN